MLPGALQHLGPISRFLAWQGVHAFAAKWQDVHEGVSLLEVCSCSNTAEQSCIINTCQGIPLGFVSFSFQKGVLH